jgi:hypothetical protein
MKRCFKNLCGIVEALNDLINNFDNFLESIPCKKCNKYNKLNKKIYNVNTKYELRECVKNQYNICQKILGISDQLAFIALKGRATWSHKGCCPRTADLFRYISSYQARKFYGQSISSSTMYTLTMSRQDWWRIIGSLTEMGLLLRSFQIVVENRDIKNKYIYVYVIDLDQLNNIMKICEKIGKNLNSFERKKTKMNNSFEENRGHTVAW